MHMVEIREDFYSLAAWQHYERCNPWITAKPEIDAMALRVLTNGFVEPLTGTRVAPEQVQKGSGLREGLLFEGISSRVRAVLQTIEDLAQIDDKFSHRIYAAEALTPFALRMRGMYPRFVGSEYTEDQQKRHWLHPILVEDLLALTFDSNHFNLVSTNEVLEHVPSIDKAMTELHRILQPGGWHIGTCPFYFYQEASVVKAKVKDGKIEHLMKPEFHGNPMSEAGSLVFELPGWNLMDRLKSLGFQKSFMRFIASDNHGIVDDLATGVFVLCCQK